MWMHIARTVTHSTVSECMQRMDWREFLAWQALYKHQPWGDEWDMTRAVAAASLSPWSKRRISLKKFFPQDHSPKPDAEQLEQQLSKFAARHNAKCERNAVRDPGIGPEVKGGQQTSRSSAISRSQSRRTRSGSRGASGRRPG